jgi:hypothetical protein
MKHETHSNPRFQAGKRAAHASLFVYDLMLKA